MTAACLALVCAGGAALGVWRSPLPSGPAVRLVSRLAPSQRIDFTLDLVLPGARALDRDLHSIENARSPQFRRFIDAGAFGVRYGVSTAELVRLERVLARDGVHVTESYPQRTSLAVSAPVAAVRRLFGVSIGRFADRAGDTWHAPLSQPEVPRRLAWSISDVSGLSTRPVWRSADVPKAGLAPADTRIAYDIAPLAHMNVLGQHQTIAIVALSDFDRSDPNAFASAYGLAGPPPTVIDVDGGTRSTAGADETNLDIEVMRSVAPGARILVYEAPDTPTGFADVLNTVIADHSASIVSTSWGQCQPNLDATEYAADTNALAAAVRVGISVFAAAGDNGAYDCQSADLTDQQLSVDWPAASAETISVGGTRLYLNPNGSYGREAGWEGVLSEQGGGGGLAGGIGRPSWQAGPGVSNAYSNGQRQVPDVAADADPGTGWAVYSSGPASSSGSFSPGGLGEAGGTSAAAPFWAASMALVQQYVSSRGVGRVGFADPMLYSIAAGPAQYPAFHDVTFGGNRHYQATPGWDYATGLGSPDVYNLARDALGYLRR